MPLYVQHDKFVKHFIQIYGDASYSNKEFWRVRFSSVTNPLVKQWNEEEQYVQILTFYLKNYEGLELTKLKKVDGSIILQLKVFIPALLKHGKYIEANQVLESTLNRCETTFIEHPWEWYITDAYVGLCFEAAHAFHEIGEFDKVQPLLKKVWSIQFKRYGKDHMAGRYQKLPLQGEIPKGASEDDKKIFDLFNKKNMKDLSKKYKKVGIKKIYCSM